MLFSKVKNKKKSQIAAEMLISVMKNENLQPGDKLPPERIIAQEMGLSRNTVREAIAALQVIGLLETRHSQGNFVVNPVNHNNIETLVSLVFKNDEDPFSLVDARIAFEPGAAALSSQICTDGDIKNLLDHFNKLREALLANDIDTYRNEDQLLHLTIAQCTRNLQIINTISALINAMNQPIFQTMKNALSFDDLREIRIEEHENIVRAIELRDEREVYETVKTHLVKSKFRLLFEEEN